MRNSTKLFINTLVCLLTCTLVYGQAPEAISYQAIIRNANNALVANTQVGMQISILQNSADGMAVYTETHQPTTNVNGLVAIEIGKGVSFDDFTAIDWSMGPYFIKTETDPNGGSNYTITGVSQLLSVPYALYAKTAETVSGTITETDPAYTNSPAANITLEDISKLGSLSGTNTGDQDISGITSNTLAIQDTAARIRADIPDISGFLTTETDPAYNSSASANITADHITKLGSLSGINTGDQDISGITSNTLAIQDTAAQIRADIPDISGFLTTETDPAYTNSASANITADHITKLGNLSGTNTGDQDISGIAVNTQAIQDTAAQIRADIRSGTIIENDPAYTNSPAANITADDITKLGNLSGENTGDQNISGIATNAAEIANVKASVPSKLSDLENDANYISTSGETDPIYSDSWAAQITDENLIASIGLLQGENTGNQDISGIATNATEIANVKASVPSKLSELENDANYITTSGETDPIYSNSWAARITDSELIASIGQLEGKNTGNQDISGIADNAQAIKDTAKQIRADLSQLLDEKAPAGTQTGEMQYWDGSAWKTIQPGYEGASLSLVNGVPTWVGGTITGYPVVETGQVKFFDNTVNEITEPAVGEDFYGQDAHYQGNAASYTDNGDGTITDNVTGLMWEKGFTRSTFADAATNAAAANTGGYDDWRVPTTKELYSLIDYTGNQGTDNPSSSTAPPDAIAFIDEYYFEFEYPSDNNLRYIDAQYLVSTTFVGTVMDGVQAFFGVNFADGRIKGYPQTPQDGRTWYLRLVRGNTTYGQNDFNDNGNETISDNATGLMWSKGDSGATDFATILSSKGFNINGSLNWEEALDFVAAVNIAEYAGYKDWRLPNAKELHSIVDYSHAPDFDGLAAIDAMYFETTQIESEVEPGVYDDYPFFWTSTTFEPGIDAVIIQFGRSWGEVDNQKIDVHGAGAQRTDPKTGNESWGNGPQGDLNRVYNHVRLVRDL